MLFSQAIRASVVRLCFLVHGMVGLFGLVYTTQVSTYWFIGVTMVLLMMEIILTYKLKKKGEWKWFIPSAFIYLVTIIPIVWLLELAMFDFRVALQAELGVEKCPTDLEEYIKDEHRNSTILLVSDYTTDLEEVQNASRELYSTTLQQTLMLVLILGRWLQPRGDLTRDQLSQLLLVYIGMAADMLEFSSETLRINQIACNWPIFVSVLTIWSWSLTQFSLGLTATKGRKIRPTGSLGEKKGPDASLPPPSSSMSFDSSVPSNVKIWLLSVGICGTELWSLFVSLLIQDGPFFITRLYIIFRFKVYDRSMIFFTCKNALLLFLMFYRLFVVIIEEKQSKHNELMRLNGRTQPGKTGSDLSTQQIAINVLSDNKDMGVYRSELYTVEHGSEGIYQMPPDGPSYINDSSDAGRDELSGGRESNDRNEAYHGSIEEDDLNYNFSEDDIALSSSDREQNNSLHRPPTPPPFPPPLPSTTSKDNFVYSRHNETSEDEIGNDRPSSSDTSIYYSHIRRQPHKPETKL